MEHSPEQIVTAGILRDILNEEFDRRLVPLEERLINRINKVSEESAHRYQELTEALSKLSREIIDESERSERRDKMLVSMIQAVMFSKAEND